MASGAVFRLVPDKALRLNQNTVGETFESSAECYGQIAKPGRSGAICGSRIDLYGEAGLNYCDPFNGDILGKTHSGTLGM